MENHYTSINKLYPEMEWYEVIEEEIQNKSDRSLAIVCGSILETQLENLLKAFLIDASSIDKELFGSDRSLSTFSAKISICYYLGLISKHEKDTLNLFRGIRNQCAHQIGMKSFEEHSKIRNQCKTFSIPAGMYVPSKLFIKDNGLAPFDTNPYPNGDPKERFINTFKYISAYLNFRSSYIIMNEQRKEFVAKTQADVLRDLLDFFYEQEAETENLINQQKELLTANINIIREASPLIEDWQQQVQELESRIEGLEQRDEDSLLADRRRDQIKIFLETVIHTIDESYRT